MRASAALALLLLACSGAAPARAPRPARARAAAPHVFLVTVDGLMPESYRDPDALGLKVPTLRRMAAAGASSDGVLSVFPTVTYPAHTTLMTGTTPARHGITTNHVLDPLGRNEGAWRWYAEDIEARTLWEAANDAGLVTALVDWPVTVGARADALVPDYWRSGTTEDQKLVRALATPGLLEAVAARRPGLWRRFIPSKVSDEAGMDVAVHIVESLRPAFLAVHIYDVDHAQHQEGPWSDAARAAIERADHEVARLIDAAQRAGIWDDTVIVLASDHGFAAVDREIRPGVLFVREGLIALDESGRVRDARAALIPEGGLAYFYALDARPETTAILLRLAREDLAALGARVYDAPQIRARGGDPAATVAVVAPAGFSFGASMSGPLVAPATKKGAHGYEPERPEMRASLIVYGPSIAPGRIEGARLIDVAPTIAALLGLRLPGAQGVALPDIVGRSAR